MVRSLSDGRVVVLRQVPAFASLPEPVLWDLAAALNEERHPAGATVVAAGDAIDMLFIIVSGRTEVTAPTPTGPVTLATQECGEMFGELALLAQERRRRARTSVQALCPLRLLTCTPAVAAELADRHPDLRPIFETPGEVMLVARFLKRASPFAKLSPDRMHSLAAQLDVLTIPAGEVIIRAGDPGDMCYLVRGGTLQAVSRSSSGETQHRATLRPGMFFGETALLGDGVHQVTVQARESCEVLALRRRDLLSAMQEERQVGAALIDMVRMRDHPICRTNVTVHQRRDADGEVVCILKDSERQRYYRLSQRGLFIWQRLDGRRSVRDLTVEYREAFGVFAPQVVSDLLARLAAAGFVLVAPLSDDVSSIAERVSRWERTTGTARKILEWHTGMRTIDTKLDGAYRRGMYLLYTRAGQVILLLLALLGMIAFGLSAARATTFIENSNGGAVLLLFLIPGEWLGLLFHEAGHAFTTKFCGREVSRAGIGWYWFGPVTFVDTSDMWLAGRRQRIAVSLAGPYANVVLAGVVALGGWLSGNPIAMAICWQFALTSYIIVLINLNPLLEYDGYYILMDLLERPNLRTHCLRWLGHDFARNMRHPRRLLSQPLELTYGIASILYVGGMAITTLLAYRLVCEHWVELVLPGAAAKAVAWVLVAGVLALTAAAVAGDVRGHGMKPTAGTVR